MFKQLDSAQKGFFLAIIAALISGMAVYFNKESIALVKDSDIYTTLKNSGTAVFVICFLFFSFRFKQFVKLKAKDWLWLIFIGLVGGSIPFLLFFRGLSLSSSAVMPNIIHKTLFIWASVFAVIFLKEKIGKIQIAALALLLFGNILIIGFPKQFLFNTAEILVLLATFIWALENIVVKYLLKRLNTEVVVFGRMFFGSIFLLIYLIITKKIGLISGVSANGWLWVLALSAILFGYVVFWYSALRNAPVVLVTSILVIASPITSLLDSIFRTHRFGSLQAFGIAIVVFVLVSYIIVIQKLKWKKQLRVTSPA